MNTDSPAPGTAPRSWFRSSAFRWSDITEGSLSDYPLGSRSCGEQPLFGSAIFQGGAPSQSDVRALAHAGLPAGDPAYKVGCILTCPSCGHRSTPDSFFQPRYEPYYFSRQLAACASQGGDLGQRQERGAPDVSQPPELSQSASRSRQIAQAVRTSFSL